MNSARANFPYDLLESYPALGLGNLHRDLLFVILCDNFDLSTRVSRLMFAFIGVSDREKSEQCTRCTERKIVTSLLLA